MGESVKETNVTMWRKTVEEAKTLLEEICEWSQLSCKTQRFDFSLTKKKAKQVWLDGLDILNRMSESNRGACLETMWQWARNNYGCNDDGSLQKPSEYMVIYGVKKN
ncbi:uncharacterized protein LOC110982325 [Acanthaster planci]|uniref:Uncharacterized protein LOC110982325 n=1 Tax=Acanthaster planci TaxID=133434 RepID=A0A8B7YST9_ACAPL|nr:uncharacterized protein LOC110982325 [Acanthaster planci]